MIRSSVYIRPLNQNYTLHRVGHKDIMYAIADGNYSQLIYKDGKKEYFSRTLGTVHFEMLSGKFLRVHRSYVVNLDYIKSLTHLRRCVIKMRDGKEITITSSSKSRLLDHFKII